MTLKATITRELLDAVDDSTGLEEVFRRYGRSKGPLYNALAAATAELRHRLDNARRETIQAEAKREKFQGEVDSLEEQRRELDGKVQELDQQVHQAEASLSEVQSILDKARELEQRGFGEVELARLFELLGNIAASQRAMPEEAVAQFFQTVERYERIVSLELEAKRAEVKAAEARAEAERWDAEARRRETHSKARTETIDLVERLLVQGVREKDLPSWEKALSKGGVSAEELMGALEEYGSLEALIRAREKQIGELQGEVARLESQVKAVTKERDGVQAAIQAVKEKALREVQRAGERAREHVDALAQDVEEYGRLREEAATLREYVKAARALYSSSPESWQGPSREVIQHLLLGITMWTQGAGRDPEVAPPEVIRRSGMLPSYARLKLSALLLWALSAVSTEEERKALGSPY